VAKRQRKKKEKWCDSKPFKKRNLKKRKPCGKGRKTENYRPFKKNFQPYSEEKEKKPSQGEERSPNS